MDVFYGKVTQLKKFSGGEAEQIVHAMMRPDAPSSTKIMETLSQKFSPDLPPGEITKIAGIVRQLRMDLGTRNASNLIRGAIKGTPLTAEMVQMYSEEMLPEAEISMSRFFGWGREKALAKLKKGHASVASAGSILGLAAATLLLTKRPGVDVEQDYPKSLFLHKPQFPARTHIRRDDIPRATIKTFTPQPIGPGITPSSYLRTSDRFSHLR